MKIGLITRYFDLRYGGIGRFSVELQEGLSKRGYEITSISTERKGTNGYLLYTAIDLLRSFPRDCDVYHCLTPIEAIHAPKERSIVTFHDLIPWLHLDKTETHYIQGRFRNLKRFAIKHYFKNAAKIAKNCQIIACTSEQTREEIIENLNVDEKKVVIVRLGTDKTLEVKVKTNKKLRIGTLSYLDKRKRIDLLIQAFLAANVDGELVIGGAGDDYDRLVHMSSNDQRVKFTGFIPNEKLNDFYNSLDLFVFPTRVEGYGLPIIEAFTCKKPVVVLRDAIIPNEVKERCIVTENLTEYLKQPDGYLDIEANYNFAKLHSWDSCVDEYINLYRQILDNG